MVPWTARLIKSMFSMLMSHCMQELMLSGAPRRTCGIQSRSVTLKKVHLSTVPWLSMCRVAAQSLSALWTACVVLSGRWLLPLAALSALVDPGLSCLPAPATVLDAAVAFDRSDCVAGAFFFLAMPAARVQADAVYMQQVGVHEGCAVRRIKCCIDQQSVVCFRSAAARSGHAMRARNSSARGLLLCL